MSTATDAPVEREPTPESRRGGWKSGEKQCPDMTEKRKGLHLEAPLQRAREDGQHCGDPARLVDGGVCRAPGMLSRRAPGT